MSAPLQIAAGLAAIAVLLALQALAFYVIWWVTLRMVAFLPMVGRRHRHRDWDRLNRDDDPRREGLLREL